MPGNFYDMAARQVGFPRAVGSRPFGMPSDDGGDDFMHTAFTYANELKGQDLMRQKEMMALQEQMRLQREAPARMQAMIERGRQLNPANKKYVLGAGSGSGKLPPSTVEADNAARDAKAAQMNKEFAAVNEAREQRAATLASAEKVAGMNANAKLAETTRKGWMPINRQDPNDPTKTQSFRMNLADGSVEPIEYGGENLGGGAKFGTKLPVQAIPPDVTGNREMANRAMDSIDKILNDKDTEHGLTEAGQAASGWTGLWGWNPTKAAEEGRTYISNLKNTLLVDLVQRLKAQSKTGSNIFGQMSNADREALEKAVSTINPNMSEQKFKESVQEVRTRLQKYLSETNEDAWKRHPESQKNVDLNQPVGQPAQKQTAAPAKKDQVWKNPKTGVYEKKMDIDQIMAEHGYGGR